MVLTRWMYFPILLMIALANPARALAAAASQSWFEAVGREMHFEAPETAVSSTRASSRLATISNACRLEVLGRLGWKLTEGYGAGQREAMAGNPCDFATPADAHGAGALRARVGTDWNNPADPDAFAAFLDGLIYSDASVCAYKMQAGPATRRAVKGLILNRGFTFYGQAMDAVFYGRSIPWAGSCVINGRPNCYVAGDRPSAALDHFLYGRVATDCALGLQVAELQTQRELYGDAAFDRAFERREVAIGPWEPLQTSRSAIWSDIAKNDAIMDPAAAHGSQKGPRWLEGLSGYIGNVFGLNYLDHPVGQNENFITVKVSDSAAKQLREHGSFETLNRWNLRLYELASGMGPKAKRLIGSSRSLDDYAMSADLRKDLEEARAILAQPLYTGYEVYVHPLGVMSLGEHIVRLLDRNPRTPYEVTLYASRMNSGLFRRYVETLAAECRNSWTRQESDAR